MPEAKNSKKKKAITEIGQTVPANFKFGLIVAVALFWTDFLRSILNALFSFANINNTVLTDFILALVATALGYVVLTGYRKIRSRLEKIKI